MRGRFYGIVGINTRIFIKNRLYKSATGISGKMGHNRIDFNEEKELLRRQGQSGAMDLISCPKSKRIFIPEFFGCLVHSPGNSQRLSFFSFTVGVYAASSTATLNGYGVVSTGSITITSSTQKLNFIAANHRDADVRMWVRNDTTGGYLYGPVTLWSEGSTHGPRSTPYTNLKNGKYRLYLECISSAPCYATGKLYHQ